jgi:hypothetical protein
MAPKRRRNRTNSPESESPERKRLRISSGNISGLSQESSPRLTLRLPGRYGTNNGDQRDKTQGKKIFIRLPGRNGALGPRRSGNNSVPQEMDTGTPEAPVTYDLNLDKVASYRISHLMDDLPFPMKPNDLGGPLLHTLSGIISTLQRIRLPSSAEYRLPQEQPVPKCIAPPMTIPTPSLSPDVLYLKV